MVKIISATTDEDFDVFRAMVREFSDWAFKTFHPEETTPPPAFADVEKELAHLPGKYADPDGAILLALVDDQVVGCIAGFRHDANTTEVSRLWVRSQGRGHGVGTALVERFVHLSQSNGYKRIVLRSHRAMTSAHRIYQEAGFEIMDGRGEFPSIRDNALAMQKDIA